MHNDVCKAFINNKLTGRIVDITQEHIDRGTCSISTLCAIALGIKETLDIGDNVHVGQYETVLVIQKGDSKEYVHIGHSLKVRYWISAFDDSDGSPITLEFKKISESEITLVLI